MKTLRKILTAAAFMGSVLAGVQVWAADSNLPNLDEPSAKVIAEEALRKDALCTKCHDETETAPILSLYQTKHGAVSYTHLTLPTKRIV